MSNLFAFARNVLRQHLALPTLAALLLTYLSAVVGHAESVIHWTNSAMQVGATVISNGSTFTTDFKDSNDVHVTMLSGPGVDIFTETFGGATPGNNPIWITNFVGSTAHQTGDGTPGRWSMLEPSSSAGSIQFDFSTPLGPGDRMLVADVDQSEKYQILAYTLIGGNYVAAPLTGWVHQAFSGETGVTPDARWPIWNPSDGTLTSSGSSLSEPLDVFAPDQNIDRVVFVNFGGGGGTPAVQFAADIAHVALLGDYNHNGVVDAADYVLWRNTLGQSGSNLPADGNQNNSIDSGDYTVWRSHFGQSAGSGAGAVGSASVPEPATDSMLLVGMSIISALRLRSAL